MGIEKWCYERREKRSVFEWVRDQYWRIWPYFLRPGELIYQIKCFLWHRYSTIRPRNLPHTWCDRCSLLPEMMFEILSQFIEEECSPGHVNWEASGHTVEVNGEAVNVRTEMQSLYDWWWKVYKKEYPQKFNALWGEAKKHQPKIHFKPLEDSPNLCSMESEFKSDKYQVLYQDTLRRIREEEYNQELELNRRLHRLVNVIPYMWT